MSKKPFTQPPIPEGVERKYMRVREAAAYLCLSVTKMKDMRAKGRGPAFRRVGHTILYSVPDMDAWMESLKSGGGVVQPKKAA